MGLNKQSGNMYGFVTHTFNVIKGLCSHNCSYCYMKVWKQNPLRFDSKELLSDLGKGNFIFVGSSTDMFADDVSVVWIENVLEKCRANSDNTYLFQTKNPKRFNEFEYEFPDNSWLCITLETNRDNDYSSAPNPVERVKQMKLFRSNWDDNIMVTIEPILDFDLELFVEMIESVEPNQVNIGADSKNHGLPEPAWDKVVKLISCLEKFTDVKLKDNLERLRG